MKVHKMISLFSAFLMLGIFVSLPSGIATAQDQTAPGAAIGDGIETVGPVSNEISKVWGVTSESNFTATTAWTTVLSIPKVKVRKNKAMIIMFQAEIFSGTSNLIVRARDGGVVIPGPGSGGAPMALASASSGGPNTNGFNFVYKSTRGTSSRTIDIQVRTQSGTRLVDERSLTIIHSVFD